MRSVHCSIDRTRRWHSHQHQWPIRRRGSCKLQAPPVPVLESAAVDNHDHRRLEPNGLLRHPGCTLGALPLLFARHRCARLHGQANEHRAPENRALHACVHRIRSLLGKADLLDPMPTTAARMAQTGEIGGSMPVQRPRIRP